MNFATIAVLAAVLLLAALAARSMVRCSSRQEKSSACCGCALNALCKKSRAEE